MFADINQISRFLRFTLNGKTFDKYVQEKRENFKNSKSDIEKLSEIIVLQKRVKTYLKEYKQINFR